MPTTTPLVNTHIDLFGNTSRIIQGEPFVDRQEQIERLERIDTLIGWNKSEIDACNESLIKPTGFYRVFGREQEGRTKLRILHHQRDRLVKVWRAQLDRMKEI